MHGRKSVDYYNILLARHAIISMEGLSVETTLLTELTRRNFGWRADHLPEMRPAHSIVRKDIGLELGPTEYVQQ